MRRKPDPLVIKAVEEYATERSFRHWPEDPTYPALAEVRLRKRQAYVQGAIDAARWLQGGKSND